MNHLRGVYTIWYRDILRFWHDKTRLVGSVIFPLLFLFVFGSGLSARMGAFGPGIDFTMFIFPGIIGMTVLMTSFMAGMSMVWDREFGFLKEVLVAPISRASVAMGKTLGSATVALLQGLVILVFAPLIGVSLSVGAVLALVSLMLLLAASLGSLGILLATRIRSMEAFQAAMQMLMFPMVFLSGAFFPLQGLPVWMNVLVKINPATYGIAPIREVILGTVPGAAFGVSLFGHTMSLWDNVAVLAAFGAVMILLAVWSFSHQE
ncbi:MAG: ABC transporter [Dehalococcoidales bacterium]|jgi:ABC-2 type transport system permease protein|nr:ABC transporter [Dehalococcoidales bacterium]MDP6576542.1 ABC transporter permease [Dehalococcoidales bacterium]|tara:strand:- start:491 stop:1279 length:789 start_codon:yes stop_codon:yes gene_type:complete